MSKSYKNKKNKGSKKNNLSLGQTTPRSFSQQNSFKNVKIFVPKSQNSSTTESVQNLDQFGILSQTSSPKISHDRSLSYTPRDKIQENQIEEIGQSSPLKFLTPKNIESELDTQKIFQNDPIEQILKENSPCEKIVDRLSQIISEDLKVENKIEVISEVHSEIKQENFQLVEGLKKEVTTEIDVLTRKEDLEDLEDLNKSLPQEKLVQEDKEKKNNSKSFSLVIQETQGKIAIQKSQKTSTESIQKSPKFEERNLTFKKEGKKNEDVPKGKGRDDCCAKCNIF